MNECNIMIRRPIRVQKKTRAIPSAPLSRSSNSPSPKESVWWSQICTYRCHSTRQYDVPSRKCVWKRKDLFLNGFAVVLDAIVHWRRITNMLFQRKKSSETGVSDA